MIDILIVKKGDYKKHLSLNKLETCRQSLKDPNILTVYGLDIFELCN